MESPVTAKAALLQALISGEGYGLDLIERVRLRTRAAVLLNQGNVYPALRNLEAEGLIESFERAELTDTRAGRPRRYYRLTAKGARVATQQREAMFGLLLPEGARP